jgi:hypothetical protein
MNKKLGFYTVGSKVFSSKIHAVIHANTTLEDIVWNFNNELFKSIKWTRNPNLNIDVIYKMRAQQIRDSYDYVIIMCSGGADSTNVLYSFLNNNIQVDEIIAAMPISGLNNWSSDYNDKSAKNIISETFIAQKPLLERVAKTNPEIRITVNDYFEDILKLKSDEWLYEGITGNWIHFSGGVRHSLEKFAHIKALAEAGKKIGIIYGIDKPIITRSQDGNLWNVFIDGSACLGITPFREEYPNVQPDMFYYTPDMPGLMVQQAHDLCKWIYKPENAEVKAYMYDATKSKEFNSSIERASRYQRGIIPSIYPSIGNPIQRVWQASKPGLGVYDGGLAIDDWMFKLHGDSRIVQQVESDATRFLKSINRKYMWTDDYRDGLKRFSRYYLIGHESKFMIGI